MYLAHSQLGFDSGTLSPPEVITEHRVRSKTSALPNVLKHSQNNKSLLFRGLAHFRLLETL